MPGLLKTRDFRILMMRIAKDKVFPFEPLIPNKETLQAMRDSRNGHVVKVGGIDDLWEDLENEND